MWNTTLLAALTAALVPGVASAFVGFDNEADPLYGWSDTEHPGDEDSPDYEFTSISRTGTLMDLSRGPAGPVDIGFPFEFYEEIYDEVYVTGSGLMGFGAAPADRGPTDIPNAADPNGFVAGLWSIYEMWWEPGRGWFQTRGSAPNRELVVEWQLTTGEWGELATFQVVLDEATGDIRVYVQDSGRGWAPMIVGIENQDGTRGIQAYEGAGGLARYAAVFSFFGESPRIRVLTEDLTVPEGGSLTLEIEVSDRQDDVESVSWDLDGDGEYDDGDDTTVELSAAEVNGPGLLTPRVRAEDRDGNVRELEIEVAVTNQPPVFTAEPVTEVLRNVEWTYDPEVVDPGGDEVSVRAPDRPEGMAILGSGALRWTPNAEDVGDHLITLTATDADDDPEVEGDGDATFEFVLTVLDNTAPGQPVIVRPENGAVVDTLRPTFLVQTPDDPEGDRLFLTFDIDTSDTFQSADLVTSGQIPASIGQTGWTANEDLIDGESYWWRVYATDGHDQGMATRARFTVDLGGSDAGPDGGEPDGGEDPGPTEAEGCTCRSAGAAGSSAAGLALALLGLIPLVIAARRR